MQLSSAILPHMRWENNGNVLSCCIGGSGEVASVSTESGSVHVWGIGERQPECWHTFHGINYETTAFDLEEAGLYCGAQSGNIKIFDLKAQSTAITFTNAHRTAVTQIVAHPAEPSVFCTGSRDATVKYWDKRQTTPISTLRGVGSINSLTMSPDCRTVVAGDDNKKVTFVDVRKWRSVTDFEVDGEVTSLRIHPLELILAAGTSTGSVELFDIDKLIKECVLRNSSRPIRGLELVPSLSVAESRFMVAASSDSLRIYKNSQLASSTELDWEGQLLTSSYVEQFCSVYFASSKRSQITLWRTDMSKPEELCREQAVTAKAVKMPSLPSSVDTERFGHQHPTTKKTLPPQSNAFSKKPLHSSLIGDSNYAGGLVPAEPRAQLQIDFSKWRTLRGAGDDRGETILANEIRATGPKMERLLQTRLKSIQVMRSLWSGGDKLAALRHLEQTSQSDFGIASDLLNVILSSQSIKEGLTTDHCVIMLSIVTALLEKGVESTALTAVRAVRFLFNKFYMQTQRTLSAGSIGVDIAAEARIEKARLCKSRFVTARNALQTLLSTETSSIVQEEGRQIFRDLMSAERK
eukprot:TRINITY_DN17965_c0_g1_i1.p1 TRINITY_DN17965_c0_g1~~TRINITY_DN17965_c0_g1_i1.p1  ORF type:complete len:579 (+),score=90.28 TRINITY_DN17965_c0_g1_i1:139-1875(+)